MSQPPNTPEQQILGMRIITGALVAGVVIFSLIVVFALGALDQPPTGQIISLVAAGMAIVMFVTHLVVPNIVASQALQQVDMNNDMELYGVYRTKMIIGEAMLEGMAFFNLIACTIEHNWWSLAIAGCLVLWMLMALPSRGRVEQWIETQRSNLGASDPNQ